MNIISNMSRFTVVVNRGLPTAPNLDKDKEDKIANTSCCFVCLKPITELQTATANRLTVNNKLVQIFIELLTGEKLCSTDSEVLLMDLQEMNVRFHCCSPCRISLTFWHDLTNSIKTLTARTSQIKSTIIANILTSSSRISCRQQPSSERVSTTSETGASSSLLQKLDRIKKEIIQGMISTAIHLIMEPNQN